MSPPEGASTARKDILGAVCAGWSSWTVDGEYVLKKVCATVKRMLRDRGCEEVYGASNASEVQSSIDRGEVTITGGPCPSVVVYFTADERTPVRTVRAVLETHPDADCIVLMSLEGFTPFAKKEVVAGHRPLQSLQYRNYIHCLVDHACVPKHRRVPPSETTDDVSSYPTIYVTDPVCQYYDLRPGDVVEHVRIVGTTDPVPFRRRVTSAATT
jgi:DNA-directed RNA polymerase subunit H (RpoH/RPB5)